jgi:hypothetical protein
MDTMARGEYYMLKDAVWRRINPLVFGMLCLQCAEDRLGRELHRNDFSSAPVNRLFAGRCAALGERLRLRRRSPASKASQSGPEQLSVKALQSRLAKVKRTQSRLGRLSAALLPYRGPNGRVPHGTLTRVLRELTWNEVTPVRVASRKTR